MAWEQSRIVGLTAPLQAPFLPLNSPRRGPRIRLTGIGTLHSSFNDADIHIIQLLGGKSSFIAPLSLFARVASMMNYDF